MLQKVLRGLNKDLAMQAGERGYDVRSPFTDRHGSMEMAFQKSNDLDRIVTFSFSPTAPLPEKAAGHYDIEVWSGASKGNNYTRFAAWSYPVDLDQLQSDDRDQLLAIMSEGLRRGFQAADDISPADLTESYKPYGEVPVR
jgi:hypothetical protein